MPTDLIDPEGRLRTVEDKDLAAAREQGYRLPSGQEAWASEHPGSAALLGGIRALPFGETALQARGESLGIDPGVNAATMKALESQNPNADFAGSAGSTLATAVATGPLTTGVKAAVVEGGIWGLSNVLDEAAIENRGATVEEVAAGGLKGALAGGLFFGGLKLAGKAATKFAGSTLAEKAAAKADDMEWAALTKGNNAAKVVTPELRDDILQAARDAGVTGKLGSAVGPDAAAAAAVARDEARAALNAAIEGAEAQLPKKGGIAALRERVVNRIWDTMDEAGVGRNPTTVKLMTTAQERKLRGEVGALTSLKDLRAWADDTLERLAASKSVKGDMGRLKLKAVHEVLSEVTDGAYAQAQKKLVAAQKLSSFLDYQVANAGAFTDINAARAIAGAAGFGVGGPLGAAVAAGIEPVLSRRAGLFGAAVLRSAGTAASLSDGLLRRAAMVTVPFMTAARQRLERAAADGPDSVLAEHVSLARGPGGSNYLGAMGMADESPSETAAGSARLAAIDGLNVAGEERGARWDGAIASILAGKPLPGGFATTGDFETKRDALKAFVANAEQHYEHGAVPALRAEALGMAVNAARYLEERLPKNPSPPGPESLKRPWEPSLAEKQKWLRYLEAVEDPQNVLARMANGSLMPEHVEAFQAAYPKLYADLQSKLYETLHVWDKPVGYRQKLQLSLMFGPQAFGMDTDALRVLQASQAVEGEPQGGSMKPDGRQKVSVSRNLETQAQRLQGR